MTFSIIPAHGEEKRTSDEPGEAVQKLAFDKAASVAEELGGMRGKDTGDRFDTVVVFQNSILGKPADEEDAVHTLQRLQDNTHQVYTGVAVLEKKQGHG